MTAPIPNGINMQLKIKCPRILKSIKKSYGRNLAREIAISRLLIKCIKEEYGIPNP
jgi:hypothetical protein